MKANEYKVVMMCLETGYNLGMIRAYKYTNSPSKDEIKDAIIDAQSLHICE
jgi:hypothetical protein